jgi:hypothetical protein
MAVTGLRASSFDDVQVELAAAEMLTTHEISQGYARRLGHEMLVRLQTLSTSEWSPRERAAAVRVANETRPWRYFGILGSLGLSWHRADLPIAELGGVLVIDIPEFTDLAPNRRLADIVSALDAGKKTFDDKFSAKYRLMRPTFEFARMKGRPMLLSVQSSGPYVEFEGLTRMCCLQSRIAERSGVTTTLPVILGVGERVRSVQPFFGSGSV